MAKKKNMVFVVTAVDYDYDVDGKARTLGLFKTHDEAKKYVVEDIDQWVKNNNDGDDGVKFDYDKMNVYVEYDTNHGCEWNIEEVNVP